MMSDVGQVYYERSIDRDIQAEHAPRLLDHVSFGRFVGETVAWEKWSVFSQNRYKEELQQLQRCSVAKKKAYFEEYYKKLAAQKALKEQDTTEATAPRGCSCQSTITHSDGGDPQASNQKQNQEMLNKQKQQFEDQESIHLHQNGQTHIQDIPSHHSASVNSQMSVCQEDSQHLDKMTNGGGLQVPDCVRHNTGGEHHLTMRGMDLKESSSLEVAGKETIDAVVKKDTHPYCSESKDGKASVESSHESNDYPGDCQSQAFKEDSVGSSLLTEGNDTTEGSAHESDTPGTTAKKVGSTKSNGLATQLKPSMTTLAQQRASPLKNNKLGSSLRMSRVASSVQREQLAQPVRSISLNGLTQPLKSTPFKARSTVPKPFTLRTEKRAAISKNKEKSISDEVSKGQTKDHGFIRKETSLKETSGRSAAKASAAEKKRSPKDIARTPRTPVQSKLIKHSEGNSQGTSTSAGERAEKRKEKEGDLKELRKTLAFKATPLPRFYHETNRPKIEIKKVPPTRAKSPMLGRRCSDRDKAMSKSMPTKCHSNSEALCGSSKPKSRGN